MLFFWKLKIMIGTAPKHGKAKYAVQRESPTSVLLQALRMRKFWLQT